MPWHTYIIECRDNTLYTGITNNLPRRLKAHNSGNGGRYTKYRRPMKLIHCEVSSTRSEALKREAYIKGLPREKKLQLCGRKIETVPLVSMNDKKFMEFAINEARKNFKALSGGPFGACIARRGRVIAVSRNTVLKNDATCHAEINAIRKASRTLGTYDLSGCVIYSTTEPCPMCFAAIHWARIKRIIYGTKTGDAKKAGFNELNIPDVKLASLGKSKIRFTGSVLVNECKGLLKEWSVLANKVFY
ncbi:MAG: deaminase [Candidatus Omnitrophica bacterium]|nr:deaminase [Candidatus Omnitrophota bacterium]